MKKKKSVNLAVLIAAVVLAAFAFLLYQNLFSSTPVPTSQLPLETLQLPDGYTIDVFARVPGARSLSVSPSQTVFVGTRGEGRVYAVRDTDDDGYADETYIIDEGLRSPNGVAFRNGSLYVAEIHRVLRYDSIEQRLNEPPQPLVVNDRFPSDSWHGWKFIRFGPDGKLYVPVGAPCNICDPGDPYAAIHRMDADGQNLEVFARGVRNTVGFDWHPDTDELWFTDNGRDWFGEDRPPDELNVAPEPGLHFGYPFCHGKNSSDDEFTSRSCDEFSPPALELGPHVAALGMRFYTADLFPSEGERQIFIAEHGSWNREVPIGYRVMRVVLENDRPVSYEPLVDGWLQGSQAWGRPVDVAILADGSLLVSDDKAGAVYRINYEG